MDTEIDLFRRFDNIKNRYIESRSDEQNNCGLMLEKLLGSTGADFNIPDFYDIEIKAIGMYPNPTLTLFSAHLYGDEIFPVQGISQKYGHPDKDFPEHNVILVKLDVKYYHQDSINKNYFYKLSIDEVNKKIFVNIYDNHFKLIDNTIHWDFDDLKEMLERKLSKLAIFRVSRTIRKGVYYYKYIDMKLYRLRSFNCFINLIKQGKITANIQTGVYKSGYRQGKFVDHGTSFKMYLKNVELLFEQIDLP
ncbi:MAG: hypothetical protein J5892_00760 [Bacilli bacterium]|nr:hypothetical protein [Bacilli bacterium]